MNKILNLEPIKSENNIKALRKLHDSCEISIRNLNSLGVLSGSYGHLLLPILLKLLLSYHPTMCILWEPSESENLLMVQGTQVNLYSYAEKSAL